jgi:hypothetical protein
VDQVGLETLDHLADEGDVAEIRGVVAKVFFEGEGKKAAGQLEGPDVALFDERLGAVTGADAEEREVAAAGKGLKVAAGVGDAVDLVKRVGEIGQAGEAGGVSRVDDVRDIRRVIEVRSECGRGLDRFRRNATRMDTVGQFAGTGEVLRG